jgi:hypothetical protein
MKGNQTVNDAPRYLIQSFKDMGKIPPNRIDAFLVDLRSCLLTAHGISDISEAFVQGIDPDLHCPCAVETMTWIDDGANDLLGLHIEGDENHLPAPIKHEHISRMVNGMHQVAQTLRYQNPTPDDPNRCPGCGVEIPDDSRACGECPTLDEYGPLD